MTSVLFLVALAVVVGALGGIHVPINGALGMRIGSTVVATLTFYAVALAVTALVALFASERSAFAALREVPAWYLVLPGVISAAVVGSTTFLIPRLGALNVFVITIAASSIVRVLISHYGWLGSPVDPINVAKLAGAALVAGGAFLVVRS
jgi:transporter family-2 protein